MTTHPTVSIKKKRHRPLCFALLLCGACALIVSVPLVGPRLLASSKWDEPDVKPVWKVDEGATLLRSFHWSPDGQQMSYFLHLYANRSWDEGTLTEVVRSWPGGGEVSRRVLGRGPQRSLFDLSRQHEEKRFKIVAVQKPKAEQLIVDRGQPIKRKGWAGRTFTDYVNPRLLLKRGDKVLRAWPLPYTRGFYNEHSAFLSPDRRVAMVLSKLGPATQQEPTWPPRSLWDVVLTNDIQRYELQQWRIADGKLIQKRRFDSRARGRTPQRAIWIGSINHSLHFDGQAFWFPLAPQELPLETEARLSRAFKQKLVDGGLRANEDSAFASDLSWRARSADVLVLYDVLSGRSRWLSPPRPKFVSSGSDARWEDITLSPDKSLLVARFNAGYPSKEGPEPYNIGSLYCWDLKKGRFMWRVAPPERGWFQFPSFSPDGKRLAVTFASRDALSERRASILVFDARTGKSVGVPLVEESPRQRFEESRARWQQPLRSATRRVSSALASGTPAPLPPLPDNGVSHFTWSPDSRYIVATHRWGILKVWRVAPKQ